MIFFIKVSPFIFIIAWKWIHGFITDPILSELQSVTPYDQEVSRGNTITQPRWFGAFCRLVFISNGLQCQVMCGKSLPPEYSQIGRCNSWPDFYGFYSILLTKNFIIKMFIECSGQTWFLLHYSRHNDDGSTPSSF